ncbi:hypothetical protein N0V93_005020 [Gnomoniopsis smithogilvyi]|uniref:DUF1295 domain-containing protein n=1 Tax=Gnomoniopsis smithogilvyi TaxID=1191159 RepID=A0A9W8YTY4_9PEZI|nr:hypothetical protein N0V93_005020 [Gnomoniopsis smithogilvyi]
MAVPTLLRFEDCASWAKTVEPYIPQLYELPSKVVDVVQGRQDLLNLYTQTNPLISGFAISVALGGVFLVVAEFNKNYSQVDRCWSILPTFYIAHFDLWARLAGVPSQRIDAILVFGIAWSARLTYNYWRKGGYTVGSEDYRWEIIQKHIPVWAFKLLNVTFISFMQSVILFLLAAPVYPILLTTQFRPDLGASDVAFLAWELLLVASEWVSDGQQWDFHIAKQTYQKTATIPQGWKVDDLNRGFLTSGLWKYSRHPNFAAEQTIWLSLYIWSAISTNTTFTWASAGVINLIWIFASSTILTEWISAGKYPEYKEYQRQVGKFMPMSIGGYQPPAIAPAKAKNLGKTKKT